MDTWPFGLYLVSLGTFRAQIRWYFSKSFIFCSRFQVLDQLKQAKTKVSLKYLTKNKMDNKKDTKFPSMPSYSKITVFLKVTFFRKLLLRNRHLQVSPCETGSNSPLPPPPPSRLFFSVEIFRMGWFSEKSECNKHYGQIVGISQKQPHTGCLITHNFHLIQHTELPPRPYESHNT